MTAAVRTERPADRAAVRRVHESAFGGPAEANLVDGLRGTPAWLPDLSLVAESAATGVVGHALFSVVDLDGGPELLSLGPMGVLEAHQRAGVGTALVEEGLARARRTLYPLVVVLGHPTYYPRFGFTPARALGIGTPYDAPDDAWLALPLATYDRSIRGMVRYPAPWREV